MQSDLKNCLSLAGDDGGAEVRLILLDREPGRVFRGWPELAAAGPLEIDPAGCQFLLAYGLVPPPYTLYSGVFSLGVGDRVELDLERGSAAFSVDYPYFEERSRGDVDPDPARLRRLLGKAVARAVPAGEAALFMQSSGKDSTGLLLGVAEAGRTELRAATYDAGYGEQEAEAARSLSRRFGVRHQTVAADPRAELAAYLEFASRSEAICADLALIPYLLVLERSEVHGGVVLDGLGNDGYMGYVEPRTAAVLRTLALARRLPSLWGRAEPPDLGARLAYLWKTALMYPAERCLAGSRLAPRTVQRLIPVETPFSSHFAALDRRWRHLGPLDFRSYVRARIFDGAQTMLKGRLAAASRGARAVFPYCDAELIDYCFHLPLAERYDARRRTNKLALRRLLEREVGDSYYLRHKASFRFDVVRFLATNESAIRTELGEARPLLRDLDRCAEFLFARKANYVHAYALVTLFMLAAWLIRRPQDAVRPLLAGEPRAPAAAVAVEV